MSESFSYKEPNAVRVDLTITGLSPAEAMQWVRTALDACPDPSGRAIIAGVHQDVTARVFAIKAVREATRAGLKDAIDAVNDMGGDAAKAIEYIGQLRQIGRVAP
jgi:hypothetical protein